MMSAEPGEEWSHLWASRGKLFYLAYITTQLHQSDHSLNSDVTHYNIAHLTSEAHVQAKPMVPMTYVDLSTISRDFANEP